MEWYESVDVLSEHVAKITTPSGHGTGFLVADTSGGDFTGIATAGHVVRHSHEWEEPIRIEHFASGNSKVIHHVDRAVVIDENDCAVVIADLTDLPFPRAPLLLAPEGYALRVGSDIGWLGFPGIARPNLCFFSGRISSVLLPSATYLVDGVATNGVSGGPAWTIAVDRPMLSGIVSAYIPNRASGDTLPGLSVVRGVQHLHDVVSHLKRLEDARTAKPEVQKAK